MIDELHAHIGSLRRYAVVLCRNDTDADDLVQEALTKAVAAAHTYRPGQNLRAWLFGILHNTFVSHRRQYARRARAATFLSGIGERSEPNRGEQRVDMEQTVRMLGRLSDEQRAVLVLVAVEELSYEEAAEALGIPVGTVMSRLARGREQLRRLVLDAGPNRLKAVR
jgi:RNA polymerase sigma-70 factor (ECF subfamily)